MKPAARISDTEWEIMKVCWHRSPLSAQAIIDALRESADWHPKTVKTLLNRLVRKGALGFEKEGRAYLYHPLVRQKECVAAESDSFLERIFNGSLKPMLAHFVENRKLSREELAELRRILKEK